MITKRVDLIGLTVLFLTTSGALALAQNLNPYTSFTLPEQAEIPVSPATPGTLPGSLTNETTGTNALTGLPCSGEGALAVSGAGALGDTAAPPPGEDPTGGTIAEPSATSVFGPTSTLGAC